MKITLARAVTDRALTLLARGDPALAANVLRNFADTIDPRTTPCPARPVRSTKKTSAKRCATCAAPAVNRAPARGPALASV